MRKLLLILFGLIIDLYSFAQVSPPTCWQTTISMPATQQVYLKGYIKDGSGKLVCELRSASLLLKSGVNVLHDQNVQTIKVTYFDKEVERAMGSVAKFPQGSYQCCVVVFPVGSKTELLTECHTKESSGEEVDNIKKSNAFKFYGQASLDFFYASPQPRYTELPATYTRLQFDPGFSLYNVPITGRFRYTTEKTGPYSEMDMFSLNFDRSTFEKNLKQIVLKKLLSTQQSKLQEYGYLTSAIKDIDGLEQQIKQKGKELVDNQLQLVKDSLERYKNKQLVMAQDKVTDLETRYKSLIAKKNQIERLVDKYKKLEALKKQWIDSGKLEALKDAVENPMDLSDPKIMIDQLKQMGAYTGLNKFLFNIKEVSIGTSYPIYTPLTLNGTQIFGGNVEWNPGLLFITATAGKVANAYPNPIDSLNSRYSQRMAGARLGIGRIHSSYLALNAVKFWDDEQSLSIPKYLELYPENATVASTDFNVSIGKNRYFELGGEMAAMFKNQNSKDTLGGRIDLSAVPELVSKNLKPNLSSNADFAFNAESSINLFKGATGIKANIQFVGPGYFTPGTYGIQNDLLKQKIRWEQRMSRAFQLNLFYHKDYDNFSESKGFRTFRSDVGTEIVVRTKKRFQANLRASRQQLENPSFFYNSNVLNLTVSKAFPIKSKANANTVLGITYYNTDTDSIAYEINSLFLFFQQSFQSKTGWMVSIGAQKAFNETAAFNNNNTGYNFSIGKRLFKKVNLNLGARYFDSERLRNLGYNFSVVGQIYKNLQLNIRAMKNDYSLYPNTLIPYNEHIIQSGIKYNW